MLSHVSRWHGEIFDWSNRRGFLCRVFDKEVVRVWAHPRLQGDDKCLSEELEILRLENEGSALGLREFEAL